MAGAQGAGWHVFDLCMSQFMQDHADHVRNGVYLKNNEKKLQ